MGVVLIARPRPAAWAAWLATHDETFWIPISGFAKFKRIDRPARMARNPATGEQVRVKAKRVARITPLKNFKDAVLSGKAPRPAKKAAKKAPAKRKAPVKRKAPAKKKAAAKKTVKRAPARKPAKRR